MNKRIQELKHQAGVDRNPDQEGLDQFAESIIAECLYLCESTAAGRDAEAIQAAIRKHFGVDG